MPMAKPSIAKRPLSFLLKVFVASGTVEAMIIRAFSKHNQALRFVVVSLAACIPIFLRKRAWPAWRF
tara:strand:- start:2707 stop:2907 length:201 start_codon:yes stop_codon:yes gene_type:complete